MNLIELSIWIIVSFIDLLRNIITLGSQILVLLQLFSPIIIVMIIDNVLNCLAVLDVRKCMHILPSKPLSLSFFTWELFEKREGANRHRWRPVVDSSKDGRKKDYEHQKPLPNGRHIHRRSISGHLCLCMLQATVSLNQEIF